MSIRGGFLFAGYLADWLNSHAIPGLKTRKRKNIGSCAIGGKGGR